MDRNQNQELASNQVPVLFLNTKKKKKKKKQTTKQWNKNQATYIIKMVHARAR